MKRPESGHARGPSSDVSPVPPTGSKAGRRRKPGGSRFRPGVREPLEARQLLAVVNLGGVLNPTEGFGYGSTIDGFGSAFDLSKNTFPRTVSLANPLGLARTNAFTQEAWVFPRAGADGPVFRLTGAAGQLGALSIRNGGKDLAANPQFGEAVLAGVLNPGAWNHVAQTFDGTTYRVFVNGVERHNSRGFAGRPLSEPSSLEVGSNASQPGLVDELRFWNVARTPAQIQKSLIELPNASEPGLVGYWKFDGNLNDATGRNGGLSYPASAVFASNAQPQVGYIEVKLDAPVSNGLGLFVTYDIVGGTAVEGVDFLSSRFRTVSEDPATERRGIIIPDKEQEGRIYVLVQPDALAELDETLQVRLTSFVFPPAPSPPVSTYTLGSTTTASLTIADSAAYKAGLAAYSSSGRFLTRDNQPGRPLYVDPLTAAAVGDGSSVGFALTSQPAGPLTVRVDSGPTANFLTAAGIVDFVTLTFDASNWDVRQFVRPLAGNTRGLSGSITATQTSGSAYLNASVNVPYTTNAPADAEVEEGNASQGASLRPTARVVGVRDASEADGSGGQFQVLLDAPAPAGGLNVQYRTTISGGTAVSPFRGGDAGEGLDLDGTFVYALNFGSAGPGAIRDAVFTSDTVAGVSVTSTSALGARSFVPNYGTTTNDTRLATVIGSVRSSVALSPVLVTLGNLVPGTEYKLQLLFGDDSTTRAFDILANGQLIVDDLRISNVQGGAGNTKAGAVVTYQFIAGSNALEIRLDGAAAASVVKDPILSGLTLERELGTSLVAPSGVVRIPAGSRVGSIPVVIRDDDVALSYQRTATVQLLAGTGYDVSTARPSDTIRVLDDDNATVLVSNFAAAAPVEATEEPNEFRDTAYNLGLLVPGKTIFRGRLSSEDDIDFFRFSIDQSRYTYNQLRLTADDGKNFDINFFRGNEVFRYERFGDLEVIPLSPQSTGTYEFQVQSYGSSGTFTITVSGDDRESNSTTATAVDLGEAAIGPAGLGTITGTSDVDLFKFTYNDAIARLDSVRVTLDSATQPVSIALLDAAGRTLDASSTVRTESGVAFLSLPIGAGLGRGSGAYFLKVTSASGTTFAGYRISFTGEPNADTLGVFSESYAPFSLTEPTTAPASQSFGLRLNSRPTSNVTLTLTSASSGSTDAASLSTTTLLFTPTNWDRYQLVAVTPLDDLLFDGDQTFTITSTSASDDPAYNKRVTQVRVLVADNEEFTQPADQALSREADAPRVYLPTPSLTSGEVVGGRTARFNVQVATPLNRELYVGLDFDDASARLGVDFTLGTPLNRDFRPISTALGALGLPAGLVTPVFADLDADGDLDLVVGTETGPLRYYLNVGSPSRPEFQLQRFSADPFAFLSSDTRGGALHPALLDGDADGDLDLVLGTKTGMLYFPNQGNARMASFAAAPANGAANPFASLTTVAGGSFFAPQAADLDGDGDLDLAVSYRGAARAAYFRSDPSERIFTRLDATGPLAAIGLPANESPTFGFVDLDNDGDLDLLMGLSSGTLVADNLGTRTSPRYTGTGGFARFRSVTAAVLAPTWASADLDLDGLPELYGGNAGTVSAFEAYRALVFLPGQTTREMTLNLLDNLVDDAANRVISYRILDSKDYILSGSSFVDATDLDGDGNRTEQITAPFVGKIEVVDNDTAGVVVTSPTGLTVTEAGASQTFTVALRTQPLSNVTVHVASSDAGEGRVAGATGSGLATLALTFTPSNWNVPQTVRVLGVDDGIADGDRPFRVRLETQGEDIPYRGLAGGSFGFTNTDNEARGIAVTGPQATLAGKSHVFSVVLQARPVGEVRVTATPTNDQIELDGGLPGDPATLVFNPLNWNVPQLVRITAGDDGLVEGFHSSQVRFNVSTGVAYNGRTNADIATPAVAYDLGDISGGVNWSAFPFAAITDAGAGWFRIKLARQGSKSDAIRAVGFSADLIGSPSLALFDKAGTTLLATSNTTASSYSNGRYSGPSTDSLPLDGRAAGEYLVRITASATTAPTFTLRVDNADLPYESIALTPIDVTIQDNDRPTARISAGPAAAEVSSQPSYFAVKLNLPAPTGPGEAGVKVFFKVTGGRATPGDSGSLRNDFRVAADGYDPVTRIGFVRVAPGNIQANVGVIPVDDKAVEDLPLSLSGFAGTGSNSTMTVSVLASIATPGDGTTTSYVLPAGTVIKATIGGRELSFTVRASSTLTRAVGGASYSASVGVDTSAPEAALAAGQGSTFKGRLESEDIEVTLLPGSGYLLPLAPDKQNLDPNRAEVQNDPANLDRNRTVARLTIFDDDVPGVRIVRLGDDVPLVEGGAAGLYGVSLLAEPLQPVTVTLSPDGEVIFDNPATPGAGTFRPREYKLETANIPASLELILGKVLRTDQGWTATFTTRLRTVSFNGNDVAVGLADSLAATGADSVQFDVPADGAVDAAGQPILGNGREYQRLVVTNLTERNDARGNFFEVRLTVAGVPSLLRINAADAAGTRPVTTTSLTFQPSNWFVLQTVRVVAPTNGFAEPGDWRAASLRSATASTDGNWNDLALAPTPLRVSDQQIRSGDAAQAFSTGLDALSQGLEEVELPLVGTLPEFAPEVGEFFEQVEEPIEDALEGENATTGDKLTEIIRSALSGVAVGGRPLTDVLTVTVEADADQVTILLAAQKTWNLLDLDLASDFGLAGLGLDVTTSGSIGAQIDLSFSLCVGLSRTHGLFIDTARTAIDVSAALQLQNFAAEGNLGFLRLNLNDDPGNPTGLSVAFHAGLNDLDNARTIQFLDANGDGLLATSEFAFGVGVDANGDGQIDLDADGSPRVNVQNVREPWTNIDAKGVAAPFPSVNQLKTTLPGAARLNFRNNNTFDEALNLKKEGVYRVRRRDNLTLYYLDANGDGRLNIGKRGLDPFATPWTSLTDAQKRKSEIWIVAANNTRWVDAQGNVRTFLIQTKGTGQATTYFFDANGNSVLDANEQLPLALRKSLDKDKNNALDADVRKDGEGTFLQGTAIAFEDSNGNGQLDIGERFVNASFDPMAISREQIASAGGVDFIDVDGDGAFLSAVDVQVRVAADGTTYADFDRDGNRDASEPSGADGQPLVVPDLPALDITYKIVTSASGRFFDVNNSNTVDAGDIKLTDANNGFARVPAAYFSIAKNATSFRFYDADGNGRLSDADFQILTVEATRFLDLDRNGILTYNGEDPSEFSAGQNATFDESTFVDKGRIVRLANDGDRLTLTELLNFRRQVRADNTTLSDQLRASLDLFQYSFTGDANLGLRAVTSFGGDAAFPSFSFDLAVNFPLFNFGDEAEAANNGVTVDFNQVTLDLGSFLTEFAAPVLSTVDDLLTPLKPLVKFLNADIKLPGYLGLAGAFEFDNRPGTSLLEVARLFAKGKPDTLAAIDSAIRYSGILSQIIDTVEVLNGTLSSGDNAQINFGDFSLSDLRAASDDPANSLSRSRKTRRQDGTGSATLNARTTAGTPEALTPDAAAARQSAMVGSTRSRSNLFNKLGNLEGFSFDLFNPDTALAILMGESGVNIATYDVPDFAFDAGVSQKFRIWGPLAGLFEGSFSVSTDISVGFDTTGFESWAAADYAADQVYRIFDGFYLNDWDDSGLDKNELAISASVAVGAGIDIGIASGFVRGGVRGLIGLDLVDQGELAGASDGRIRGSDIAAAFSTNPLELFQLNGVVEAFLGAKVEIDFFFFSATVYEQNFATFKLAEFTLNASGFSGSSDFGKVQGGPIAGGTVWLDANNNGLLDQGEPTTTTDVEGNYQLFIPDGYDTGSGVVRVEGGTDVTTGTLQGSAFSKQIGQDLVTPLTTLADQLTQVPIPNTFIDFNEDGVIDTADVALYDAAFTLRDPAADQNRDGVVNDVDAAGFALLFQIAQGGGIPNRDQANRLVLFSLGLDPDLELGNLQHFDLALVNDPRARTLLFRVDATEALIDSLEAWFEGAAGLSRNDHVTAPILTDVLYRSFATQIAEGSLDITRPDVVKAIIRRAIPWANAALANLGVPNRLDPDFLELHIDAVASVLVATTVRMQILASGATDGVQVAALITKAKLLNERDTDADLYLSGQGELDDATLVARNAGTDQAALDRIVATTLPPIVSLVPDVVLPQDGRLVDRPFTIINFNGVGNSTFRFATTNPTLLPTSAFRVVQGAQPGQWLLSITPAANLSGAGLVTITYIDAIGEQASQTFRVVVNPQSRAPEAQDDVVRSFDGNAVTFDVLTNDRDLDGEPLSVSFPSAPEHGTLTRNPNGSFTYTPDPGFVGQESLQYVVSDGRGGTDLATVTFFARPTNFAPQARGDAAQLDEDGSVVIRVLGNDSDADGDTFRLVSVSQPARGTVVIQPDGTVIYRPNRDAHGTDSFTYVIQDARGETATGTVNLAINPVNDAPTAPGRRLVARQDRPTTFRPLAITGDIDGDRLSLASFSQPAHGRVRLNPDGTLTYTPAADYRGSDRFGYRVSDGRGGFRAVVVNVEVIPAPPTVLSVAPQAARGTPGQVVVSFSNDLDPTRAVDLALYQLTSAGADGFLGTADDVAVKIRSAAYDAATRRVTLTLGRRLNLSKRFRFIVSDARPISKEGLKLDGNADGQAGGLSETLLGRPRILAGRRRR